MTLPKFIITIDGVFRLGQVNQHKHLLKPGDQCIGGGYYHFDFVSNRIILDRESYDFGRPKWHLLEVLKVPSTYRGMRIVYKYDDGFHDDFNVSEELPIDEPYSNSETPECPFTYQSMMLEVNKKVYMEDGTLFLKNNLSYRRTFRDLAATLMSELSPG